MCGGISVLDLETKNAKLGIAHSHKHNAADAAKLKDLHKNYKELSANGGLEAAIEAEKTVKVGRAA